MGGQTTCCAHSCAISGPLRTKSRCDVPLCISLGGGTRVMLVVASGQCMEQHTEPCHVSRAMFTMAAWCAAVHGGGGVLLL